LASNVAETTLAAAPPVAAPAERAPDSFALAAALTPLLVVKTALATPSAASVC
jgi:hypothetical protein